MTKTNAVDAVAAKTGLTKKDTEAVINAFIEEVKQTLAKGEKVSLIGFGTFEVKTYAARTARNLRTKEIINVPASKRVSFSVGKPLKELVK